MKSTDKGFVTTTRFFEKPGTRSAALHLFITMLLFCYVMQLKGPIFSSPPVEVTLIEPNKSKEEMNPSKMVVHRSEGVETDTAKKNSYLSDKTRVVEQERSARNEGEALPLPVPKTNPKQPSLAEKQQEKKAQRSIKLSDLGMTLSKKEITPDKEADAAKTASAERSPSTENETVKGGQYILGMKDGETSALNTKEFVFYSYFERVRKQLNQAWQPMIRANVIRIFQSGRRLASNEDYVTKAKVTLNSKGEILKIQLLEETGTHDLDQAALDALNKAGPYPNPPQGLIDSHSGTVEIRWDFILKT